jgi:Terminase RNaseH-like domain/Terminase large subunit, T4likevirus-type, N-terminal
VTIDRRLLTEYEAVLSEVAKRRAKSASVDPVEFAKLTGLQPDPWQEKVLRWKGQRLLLNCSRQAGKSTTTAVLSLHRAITVPKSLILLISPSLRQSGELFLKVKESLRGLAEAPPMQEDNKLSLTLANRSRIVSLPSSEGTIRGFSSVSLIVEDEAAFVSDDLNTAVRPMLAVSGGQLILMSTPKGRRGHFFEAWEKGGDVWDRIKIEASEVSRISPEWLDAERKDMFRRGMADLFRQEYQGEFVNAAAGRVFGGFDEKVNCVDALPESSVPWNYQLGLDFGIVDQNGVSVAAWRENDPVVYIVKSYRLTATPTQMAEEVQNLQRQYNFISIVGDEGGMGKAFAEEMRQRYSIPIMPADKANKIGTISLINGEMRVGNIQLVRGECAQLIEEMNELPWADSATQRPAEGFPDHACDSMSYLWKACPNYNERVPQAPVFLTPMQIAEAEAAQLRADDMARHEAKHSGDAEWAELFSE